MSLIKFTLYDKNGQGVHEVSDNETPIGWDSLKIILARNEKYHGIFPEISMKLKWFGRAANIIHTAYKMNGIEAEVYCIVHVTSERGGEISYTGLIDFRDISITERFVECNIKQHDCLQLFLDRTAFKVNLYDEPCFTELTFDKTAYRTRYRFAPYWITFPEKTIAMRASWKLKGCSEDTPDCYSNNAKQFVRNKFQLNGGLGCSLHIATDPSDNTTSTICGNSDPPENNDNEQSQFVDANGNYLYYIINGSALTAIENDAKFINSSFSPMGLGASISATNNIQYHRDCGNNKKPKEKQWSIEKQYNGGLEDCDCCINCDNFVFTINAAANVTMTLDIVEGVVEWYQYKHELIFQFGDYIQVLATTGVITESNSCNGWDVNSPPHLSGCCGAPACLSFNGTINVPPCDTGANPKMAIYTRTLLGFKAGGGVLGNSNLSIQATTYWIENSGEMVSSNCIPDLERIGETSHPVYMIHESLSRIVEHYTNNCLRVKSNLYARPNSMEWADNCQIQNAGGEFHDPNIPNQPDYDECGEPKTSIPPNTPCEPVTANCDCNGPLIFPNCVSTFDPTEYRFNSILGAGKWFDEAFITITSGINLRDFGRECFVSFDDMFEALSAIHNIGVGWTGRDPHNLYIEHASYFYQPRVTINLGEVDLYTSNWRNTANMENYFNRFNIGYQKWLQDEINTIDEFNTKREYSLPIKNVDNTKEILCPFIASGYTIEWQRRQRYTVDSRYDKDIFIICVGRSVDINNQININGNWYESHMWRAETGVDSAQNIMFPLTAYNWRITPYYMSNYWLMNISANMWHKIPTLTDALIFNSAEVNYFAYGSVPASADLSVQSFLVAYAPHSENDNIPYIGGTIRFAPERVEFSFPLTIEQFLQIRNDPYGLIVINKEAYYLEKIEFSFVEESKLTLIKAQTQYNQP